MNLIKLGDMIINMDNIKHVRQEADGSVRVYLDLDYTILAKGVDADKLWARLTELERSNQS